MKNVLLIIFSLFALGYSGEISKKEKWIGKKFTEYCNPDSSVIRFLAQMRKDFFRDSSIDFEVINDSLYFNMEQLNKYIKIRDSWKNIPTIENLILGEILTRRLIALLNYHLLKVIYGKSADSVLNHWQVKYDRVYISKEEWFAWFESVLVKKNVSFKPLGKFENKRSRGYSKGWRKYVQQFGLKYECSKKEREFLIVPLGKTEFSETDRDHYLKIRCVYKHIINPRIDETVHRIAYLLDASHAIKLRYEFERKNTFKKGSEKRREMFKKHIYDNSIYPSRLWMTRLLKKHGSYTANVLAFKDVALGLPSYWNCSYYSSICEDSK